MENYNLPINTSRIDYDQMIQLIKDYLRLKGFLQKKGPELERRQRCIEISGIFIGTTISSIGITAGVVYAFLLKNALKPSVQEALLRFVSGVMAVASVWSLLILSTDMSGHVGKLVFIPASVGSLSRIGFLLLLDEVVPHLHIDTEQPKGSKSSWKKSTMLVLVVAFHNISEGMAADVAFAGLLPQNGTITLAGALAPPVGIAMQNFPGGATISLPLERTAGKGKAFIYGMLSDMVEPIDAALMLVLAEFLGPVLPYFLSFTAGAMIYVVVEELIPGSVEGEYSSVATTGFAVEFVVTMILDVALGQALKEG